MVKGLHFLNLAGHLATVAAAAARSGAFRGRVAAPRMAENGLGGPEVAVLGGGFGGLYTALRLVSLPMWATISSRSRLRW